MTETPTPTGRDLAGMPVHAEIRDRDGDLVAIRTGDRDGAPWLVKWPTFGWRYGTAEQTARFLAENNYQPLSTHLPKLAERPPATVEDLPAIEHLLAFSRAFARDDLAQIVDQLTADEARAIIMAGRLAREVLGMVQNTLQAAQEGRPSPYAPATTDPTGAA